VKAIAPHRQAMLDRIAAHLVAAAPMPVGTVEIGKVVGRVTSTYPCSCKFCGHQHERQIIGPARNHDVVPLLRRLVRAGLAEEIPMPHVRGNGTGQHYWRWTGPDRTDGSGGAQ